MAGFRVVTNVDGDRAAMIAANVAKSQGFTVSTIGDRAFTASKGFILSLFVAGFAANCNFKVFARQLGSGDFEVVIEQNKPWWTGTSGMSKVKSAARSLADGVADGLKRDGGTVVQVEEI